MDGADRQLLSLLEQGLPFKTQPFKGLAKTMAIDEAEVLLRLGRLKQLGKIGPIRGIFDSRKLGYKHTLAAMQVPETKMGQAVRTLSGHPGIPYIGERDHAFNLWFRLSLPAEESTESHLGRAEEFIRPREILALPALKFFRKAGGPPALRADLPELRSDRSGARPGGTRERSPRFSAREIEIIRALQEEIPLTDEPYRRIALELELSEEKLFETILFFKGRGVLKRIAVQKREQPPLSSMILWQIPEEKVEDLGQKVASFDFVRCGLRRPAYPKFPYTLYVVLEPRTPHPSLSPSRGEGWGEGKSLEEMAHQIERRIGAWPRLILRELRTYKNDEIFYFPKGLRAWWEDSYECPPERSPSTKNAQGGERKSNHEGSEILRASPPEDGSVRFSAERSE